MLTETVHWETVYDKGIPRTLEYPEATLLDHLRDAADRFADRTALIFKGAPMSYAQLDAETRALSAGFAELGVSRGDRVALLMPNVPQAVFAMFATWAAGAIAVPLNPMYGERELELVLSDIGCDVVVLLSPLYWTVKRMQRRTGVRRIVATNIKEYLPKGARMLFSLYKDWKDGHRVELEIGDLWLQPLLERHALSLPPAVEVKPGDDAVILFTGGTTGTPKGAIGTHRSLIMSAMQARAWFSGMLAPFDDVVMLNMPLFHVMGTAGVLAPAIVNHNPLSVVPDPRDIDDIVATISEARVAFLPAVPTLFGALMNHPDVIAHKADLRSLKLCISGAAPLAKETKSRFEKLSGARIVEGYSLTESMLASVMTPLSGTYKPGSVGLPLPDVALRIVDSENSNVEVLPGDVGEVLMRAPQLMRRYWGRDEETDAVLRDGWLHTGDLGYLDRDGYLFLVDRKKDVIKTNVFQVWPREVEEVLCSFPAVSEAGVAGIPDAEHGEVVKAWVVLRGEAHATPDALRAWCEDKLAPYQVPREIDIVETLPRSHLGKVLRRELRDKR